MAIAAESQGWEIEGAPPGYKAEVLIIGDPRNAEYLYLICPGRLH